MCIGNKFCIVCEEVIDAADLAIVRGSLEKAGREIISITYTQMQSFAGNMLQLLNADNQPCLVMSATAHDALDAVQKQMLAAHTKIITVALPVIEGAGGGGARCMMAEI